MNLLLKDIMALVRGNKGYVIQKTNIVVQEDKIISMDVIPEGFVAEKVIDGKQKLAIPGLINCHTHSYMSLFRNCADDLAFSDWLFSNILPLEDKLLSEDAYWGANLAILEMIKSGTTCFSDMQMHIHETTRAVEESGIRAVISRGLVGNGLDEGGQKRFREAKEEMEKWSQVGRLSFMLGPHAPYTCDKEYLRFVVERAKEQKLAIHIHLSESLNEVKEMQEQHHCSPIEFAEDAGLFEVPVLAAHCVHLSEKDINILKTNKVSVVTNPASNMKLGNGFANLASLHAAGVNLCIGTDGAASNNSLNLFHEMNLLTLIHKGVTQDAQAIGAQTCLQFATENAAKAILLEDEIGSLTVGKKADIVILDLDRPQMMPQNNLVSSLCYSANGSEVETVIIDGKLVLEQGKMLYLDEERISFEVNRISKRLGIHMENKS